MKINYNTNSPFPSQVVSDAEKKLKNMENKLLELLNTNGLVKVVLMVIDI